MTGSSFGEGLAARPAEAGGILARPPAIGLRFWPVLWRLALILTAILELELIRRAARAPWPAEIATIFAIVYLPTMASAGLMLALAGTAALQVVVRVVLRPLAFAWHSPGGPALREEAGFFLSAGEAIAWECPARRAIGRTWVPGVLYRTGRGIGFRPRSWSAEPWSATIPEVGRSRAIPRRGIAAGLMHGWPELIAIRDRSGEETLFAVADPGAVLARLPAADPPSIPPENDPP